MKLWANMMTHVIWTYTNGTIYADTLNVKYLDTYSYETVITHTYNVLLSCYICLYVYREAIAAMLCA